MIVDVEEFLIWLFWDVVVVGIVVVINVVFFGLYCVDDVDCMLRVV